MKELSEALMKSVSDLSENLVEELSKTKSSIARRVILVRVAKLLRGRLGEKRFKLMSKVFFEVAEELEMAYIERYIRSVYLSGDYEKFRKTRPVDVVRMLRFYFKKKDGTPRIPITYAPVLLKMARNIKAGVRNLINYRLKTRNPYIPPEVLFEEIKEEYREKKKVFGTGKKRKGRRRKTE